MPDLDAGRESLLSARQREDALLVARTIAWTDGLRWDDLPEFSPQDKPWVVDRDCLGNTALVILGHRGLTYAEALA